MRNPVPAWDKRTGKQVLDPVDGGPKMVPKRWLDRGTFPNLAASAQGSANSARSTTTSATKKEG